MDVSLMWLPKFFFYSPRWPKQLQLGALPCLMLLFFISRWFLQFQHVDPAEAVCIHEDLQSRHSLGIHWGTFPTGKEVCYSCTNGHVTCIINSPGNIFVGVCCLVLQTLTLFQTKKCILPHPFSDLASKIRTHFQTWRWQNVYTFSDQNGTETHTYMGYIREYPPPPLGLRSLH